MVAVESDFIYMYKKMHTKDLAYTQCLNQNTINVHSVVKNMIRKCMLISRGSISYLELIFDGTIDIYIWWKFLFFLYKCLLIQALNWEGTEPIIAILFDVENGV